MVKIKKVDKMIAILNQFDTKEFIAANNKLKEKRRIISDNSEDIIKMLVFLEAAYEKNSNHLQKNKRFESLVEFYLELLTELAPTHTHKVHRKIK